MTEIIKQEKTIVIPSSGIEVTLVPVSQLLVQMAMNKVEKEYRARGEPIDPPKYKVRIDLPEFDQQAEPEYIEYEHDETTLDDVSINDYLDRVNGDTEKAQRLVDKQIKYNHMAWNRYLKALAKLEREQREITTEVMFRTGVKVELPEDDEWMRIQHGLVDLPTDPEELRYHYIVTQIIKTPQDGALIITELTKLSMRGMEEAEQIEAASDTFQGGVRGIREPADIPGRNSQAVRQEVGQTEMENVEELSGSESGDENAYPPQRISGVELGGSS